MSVQDSDAMTTCDYSRQRAEDFLRIREKIKLLENGEGTLSRDLGEETDVSDEDLRLFVRTPKSSVKAKLCREIRHTRQELYSLDNDSRSKRREAYYCGLLPRNDILNRMVGCSVRFENDDTDDVTTRMLKGKTIRITCP